MRKLKFDQNPTRVTRVTRTLHEDLCTYYDNISPVLLRMRNVSDKSYIDKIKTHIVSSITFFLIVLFIRCYGKIGPRRDEVTGEWRRLHNDELNDLYSSPNIVRVIKSRRLKWAGHVARMGEERGVYRVLVGKPEGRNHWGDLGLDGWIILGWVCGERAVYSF